MKLALCKLTRDLGASHVFNGYTYLAPRYSHFIEKLETVIHHAFCYRMQLPSESSYYMSNVSLYCEDQEIVRNIHMAFSQE
jgi:hypothetical protein